MIATMHAITIHMIKQNRLLQSFLHENNNYLTAATKPIILFAYYLTVKLIILIYMNHTHQTFLLYPVLVSDNMKIDYFDSTYSFSQY
jgi:hypothetical protein